MSFWRPVLRKKKKSSSKNDVYVRRTTAQIRIGEEGLGEHTVLSARVILGDVSETEVDIFCKEQVPLGTPVGLTLDGPKRFYVKGLVSQCRPLNSESKIISAEKFTFRVKVKFILSSEAEKVAVREFVEQARLPDYVKKIRDAA